MKSLSKILFVAAIVVAFTSCSKKDEVTLGDSSVTGAGVISGTIASYTSGSIDSVVVLYGGKDSKSPVSTSGQFSLTVSLSSSSLERIGSMSGVQVSDTSALTGAVLDFYTYKSGIITGLLMKSNYTSINADAAGMTFSTFVYSDRDLTLKGSHTETETLVGYSSVAVTTYDVTLKKGWNEVVSTIDAYSTTTTGMTQSETVTTTIPTGLSWNSITESQSLVRSNAKLMKAALLR